jgi:HEAT repeat protein
MGDWSMNCVFRRIAFWIAVTMVAAIALPPNTIAQEAPAKERQPVYRGRSLDVWLGMLDGTDDEQLLAIKAIGEFGPEARPHADLLALKLSAVRDDIRLAAANQLAAWGPDAKDAAVDLAHAMRDIDPEVGDAAAEALHRIGRAAGNKARIEVARIIEDRDAKVRDSAVQVMSRIGWHDESVAVLGQSLASNDASVRYSALGTVDDMPPELAQSLRGKIQALFTDANAGVRSSAQAAIVHLVPDETCVVSLRAAIEHKDNDVKRSGLEAIGHPGFRELAAPLAANIAALLEHDDFDVRLDSAFALNGLKHRDVRAVVVLREALPPENNHGHGRHSDTIVEALGDLGPLAKDAVPFLIKHFQHYFDSREFQKDRAAIGVAIAKIGPDAVKAFAGLLTSRRADMRLAVVAALEEMGSTAEPAVPQLIATLNDPDVEVRSRAANALRNIGPAAKSAAEPLANATRLASERVKDNHRRAGRGFGPDEMKIFPEVTDSIQAMWLTAAAEAWWRVSADPEALEPLALMLADRNDESRDYALAALERSVGKPPASFTPGLTNVLEYCIAGYPPTAENAEDSRSSFRSNRRAGVRNGTDASIINALRVLERLGEDAKPSLGLINSVAANDPRTDVLLAAARASWRLSRDAEVVKFTAQCLSPDRFSEVQEHSRYALIKAALEVLMEMGDAAKTALPQITLAYQQATDDESKAAIGLLLKKLDAEGAAKLGVE